MYKSAIYVRCSKYNSDKENSIYMQKYIINKFIESKPDIVAWATFVDNGYSGLDFFRPDFIKMMEMIDKGEINCVIVKDLSRLGRNYIETGRYVQYIFPEKQVRFISICDNYDSLNAVDVISYFMVPMKNYINDLYSRDISKKVRSALDVRRKEGLCTLNKVSYGYKKLCINGEIKIVIDKEVEKNIKEIFNYSLEGYSLQGIADILNKKGIATPLSHRGKDTQNVWYPMMVKRILTDEMYTGILTQGKVKKVSYKSKQREYVNRENWYRKYNNHESIIDANTFYIVNRLLKYDIRKRKGHNKCHNLGGILLCGCCKKVMICKNKEYICGTYNKGEGCENIKIKTEDINIILKGILSMYNVENLKKSESNVLDSSGINEGVDIKREKIAYLIKKIEVYKYNKVKIVMWNNGAKIK